MTDILHARCFHHPAREAVGRCPYCHRFYCRECITEHEGKVICAACLAARTERAERRRSAARAVLRGVGSAVGFICIWMMFYALGRLLLAIPSTFHEGTIWKQAWNALR